MTKDRQLEKRRVSKVHSKLRLSKSYEKLRLNKSYEKLRHSKSKEKLKPTKKSIPDIKSTISIYSSSLSSEISAESIHLPKQVPSEHVKDIFDILYDTSDFSSEEEEEEEEFQYSGSQTFAEKPDFFENFKDLPDIANVSEDVSVVAVVEKKMPKPKVAMEDEGHFVDPITGIILESSTSDTEKPTKADSIDAERYSARHLESKTDSESLEAELSELSIPEDDIRTTVSDTEVPDKEPEDMFEKFLDLGLEKIEKPTENIDWEAVAKEQEAKKLKDETLVFLDDLIHRVVNKAEILTPETILRRNVDKRKLLLEFAKTHSQFEVESKYSEMLQRKIVEFFKRKQSYRAIKPDITLATDTKKYKNALLNLDQQLVKESSAKEAFKVAKNSLVHELNECKYKTSNQILAFENLVRKSLTRDKPDHILLLVEPLLKKIGKYRKEISDVRVKMITEQHNQAMLSEKLTKLEDLGNGLTIKNYDHIHNETQTLDKKIEERNADLKRLYMRSRKGVNILAHYKEKQSMVRDVIETQRNELRDLLDEREILRRRSYGLKLQRNRLREEIKNLSFKGGLVDKPLLMYDYDETVEICHEERELVEHLRATLATIQQRISRLEKRLTL